MPTVSLELPEDQLRDLGTHLAEAARKLRLAAALRAQNSQFHEKPRDF